jgi:signal transduction histidine kinase
MRYLYLFCLWISISAVSAQSVDGLLLNVERAETDSLKIAAYKELVNHYQYANVDSARFYGKEGLRFAERHHYTHGRAVMILALGQVNERHGFLEQAKTQYSEARAIFTSTGLVSGVAAATNGLGVIAGRTGKYDEATRYFLEALSLYEETRETRGIVQTYIKLGVVSDLLGNLDKALEYYLKAEALNTEAEPSNASLLTLLNNIGIVYGKRNNIPEALKYFRRGLRDSDPRKSTAIHIALLGSLGIAYEKSAQPDSALYFQQQALAMAQSNDLPEEEARALVNMSSLLREDDPAKSLEFLEAALAISGRIEQLNLMTEVYEAMIYLHKKQNDYKTALELLEKRQLLKDSMFSIQKTKEIANLHAHQTMAEQDNEIRSLAMRNERSMIQRNVMIVIALIAVSVIGIVWYYTRKIYTLNARLITKQRELENSNTIKDKLFSVLGHDLRAPLNQVIGLMTVLGARQNAGEESLMIDKLRRQSTHTLETLDNLLLWGQSQLKGIRLNQQRIHVKEQISKSIHLTRDYASEKNVRLIDNTPGKLTVHADPSHFDLVMRNLLSNAIKFSHSGGTVEIGARATGNQRVVIWIKDSGVGISKALQSNIFTTGNESIRGTWNEKGTGIGLMLCQEYVNENDGRLWVESESGQGATFFISLKQEQDSTEPAYETAFA